MANRYWVGGAGTWDVTTTTNWSASSGGSGGASVPTSADDVFINGSSGTGTIALVGTTSTPITCKSLNTTGASGITLSTSGSAARYLDISGDLTIGSGTTVTGTVFTLVLRIIATSTITVSNTNNLLTNTFLQLSPGAGNTVTLASNINLPLNNSTNASFILESGTLNLGSYTATVTKFNTRTVNAKAISLSTGKFVLTGLGTGTNSSWDVTIDGGSCTFNNPVNIDVTLLSQPQTFVGGGKTYGTLTFVGSGDTSLTISDANNTFTTVANSKTTPFTIILPASSTTTASTWSAQGSSGNGLRIISSTTGTQANLSLTNSATLAYTVVKDINLVSANGTLTNGGISNSSGWIAGTGTQSFVLLSSGTTWTVPADWNNSSNTINIFGAGGGSSGSSASNDNKGAGGGGGGGGYAKLINQSYTPGNIISYYIGARGIAGPAAGTNFNGSSGGIGGTTSWNGSFPANTITYVADAKAQAVSSALTISVPAGTVAGDLMIALIHSGSGGSTAGEVGGLWSPVLSVTSGRSIYIKIASGSEPASYTFRPGAGGNNAGYILTYRNAVYNSRSTVGTSASPSVAPATTNIAANSMVLAWYTTNAASVTYTTPTGYTALDSDSDATAPSSAIFYAANQAVGTTGTITSTPSGSDVAVGISISLSPAIVSPTAYATGGNNGRSTITPGSSGGTGGTGVIGTLAPTYIAGSKTQTLTNSTSLTIDVPTGTVDGDLMIAMIMTGTSTTATWNTLSGWTAATTSVNSRGVYYRIASSEPASYTFTTTGNSSTNQGYIFTYRNAKFDVISAITAASNPTVTASITTSANNAVLLYYVGIPTNASNTYTAPTGFSTLDSDSDATLPSSAVFFKTQAVAGATGTVSCTGSTTNNRAFIMSIIPSATVYTGGTGGAGSTSTGASNGGGGGGGGGGAGPLGNGANGGTGFAGTAVSFSGGGGGGNGGGSAGGNGSSGTSGAGGNNNAGSGGGAAVTSSGGSGVLGNDGINGGGGSGGVATAGGSGGDGTDILSAYGSGGGSGGSANAFSGISGASYGSGGSGAGNGTTSGAASAGGSGAQGAIIITYVPTVIPSTATGNFFLMFM